VPPFPHALELFIQSTFFFESGAHLARLSWQERTHRPPTGAAEDGIFRNLETQPQPEKKESQQSDRTLAKCI
jgi:hypothetical protein